MQLEILEIRDADGRHAACFDECGEVCLGRPVLGYVRVRYRDLAAQSPESARRAVLTNAPDLRAAIQHLLQYGTFDAEGDAAFYRPSAADGTVWLGVLQRRDIKSFEAQPDLPSWALGVTTFELERSFGCSAALGYCFPGELKERFGWVEQDRDTYVPLHEIDQEMAAIAAEERERNGF